MARSYTVAPHLANFDIPLAEFAASRPEFESFGVGGYIFSHLNPTSHHAPRVLLLQRALTDSMPGCWEGPGGAAEPDDRSLLSGVAREVLEETGLHVSRVLELVAVDAWQHTRRNGTRFRIAKYSFLVDVYESVCTRPDGKIQLVPLGDIPVSLEATEHRAYDWAAEEDVRLCLHSGQGKYQLPPSGHQGANILRCFDFLRGVGEQSAMPQTD
ncbi:hypothetical protein N7512_002051 [Penicillium capsulatum]|nr:hypothetical protein N7512_002051 [Penicillium capsulatum]